MIRLLFLKQRKVEVEEQILQLLVNQFLLRRLCSCVLVMIVKGFWNIMTKNTACYYCADCDNIFMSKSDYDQHLCEKHEENQCNCNNCILQANTCSELMKIS